MNTRNTARRIRTKVAGALASVVLATAALAGCSSSSGSDSTSSDSGTSTSAAAAAAVDGAQNAAAVLADNKETHETADYDESDAVEIQLNGDSASADGDGVTADGSTVTITAGGTYRLSGSLSDGQVIVNAPDATVTLILDGVEISSSSGSAIAATEAEQFVVVLADGSENILSDTDSYAGDADANAALYSAGDLTIGGSGSLTVSGSGSGNDAIASTDGLVIEGGTITVEAADDGVRGKDYLVVEGGELTVAAGDDGLKADNEEDTDRGYIAIDGGTVKVTADGDGLDAATDVVVTGGTLDVTSGVGRRGRFPALHPAFEEHRLGSVIVRRPGKRLT